MRKAILLILLPLFGISQFDPDKTMPCEKAYLRSLEVDSCTYYFVDVERHYVEKLYYNNTTDTMFLYSDTVYGTWSNLFETMFLSESKWAILDRKSVKLNSVRKIRTYIPKPSIRGYLKYKEQECE